MTKTPILLWFRRDLRLGDHPALCAATSRARPVIPVFLHDEVVSSHGAAPRFRLGHSIEALSRDLSAAGSRLILRRGRAIGCLRQLIAESGAGSVWWTRAYDPDACSRDEAVRAALEADGVDVRRFGGHLLFEPEAVSTKDGGFYKVFTPMWNAVRGRDVSGQLPRPGSIPAPDAWPASDALADWNMGRDMRRGREIVAARILVGEDSARGRLDAFIERCVADYGTARDNPAIHGTSGLSENLTYGEISPHACWNAGWRALEDGKAGAETFLKQLVWREFAHHLAYHTPQLVRSNWREGWDAFPWQSDETAPEVIAWKQGRTGVPIVDAGMREMYVTGRMNNRARMNVASYLTKHLMTHWKIGMRWFGECLTDWDPASNAMGWQWAAGSGPDAAPYFRIFNPVTQLAKFDPEDQYAGRWIAERQSKPHPDALDYFKAVPKSWHMDPSAPYPAAIVDLKQGRARALTAYETRHS